jgi:hypothetical protein
MNNKTLKILSHEKSNKKPISKIVKRVILIGASLFTAYILASCGGKEEAKEPVPTPTIEVVVTPTPTPEPTATPEPTPEPTPDYSLAEAFISEMREKGYKYIFNGDIISFGPEMVADVFKFLEGSEPEGFSELSNEEKTEKILNYQQVIMSYCGDSIDPTTGGPIDFSKYVDFSTEQSELLNYMSNIARNIALLSVNNPVDGKIIEAEDQMGAFSEEYVAQSQEFMLSQMAIRNGNATYKKADAWYKLLLDTMIVSVNKKHIPAYFYVDKESDPEVRNADYYATTYLDMDNLERYYPVLTNNGLVYVGDISGRKYTQEQMEDFMNIESKNYNPNIKARGIEPEAFEERERVAGEIEMQQGIKIEKIKTFD